MLNRKITIGVVLAALTVVPTLSFAAAPCVFKEHRVRSIKPYQVERSFAGHVTMKTLGGTEFYVQAEPGLTAEWLRLEFARQIAQMRGAPMKDCPFDVDGVRVQVDSAGTGFIVKVIAPDSDRGAEVLRRARLLLG